MPKSRNAKKVLNEFGPVIASGAGIVALLNGIFTPRVFLGALAAFAAWAAWNWYRRSKRAAPLREKIEG